MLEVLKLPIVSRQLLKVKIRDCTCATGISVKAGASKDFPKDKLKQTGHSHMSGFCSGGCAGSPCMALQRTM